MHTLLDAADIERLREALESAGFREPALRDRYGAEPLAAARRGDHRALLAASDDGDRLSVLVRLFVCRVDEDEVAEALAPLSLEAALAAGLIAETEDGYRAGLSLEIHGEHWLLSDAPAEAGRGLAADHVLGPAGAAKSMAGYMLRRPVESALDVGTGGGVLAFDLSGHAKRVTGTDISRRALLFAATNAVLNGLDWELLAGDMLEPVAGRRFDQIVSNPPFIVGPGHGDFDYRDSGRPGDAVCAELAAAAPGLLNPGGTLQFMANWCHVKGQQWSDRIAGWFAGSGCTVWAIQREVADPLEYVRFWQRDAAVDHDPHRLAAWLDWFDANDIEAVGFGVVNARFHGGETSVVCEDLRHTPERPFSEVIGDWFDVHARLAELTPEQLYGARLRLAEGVRLHQEAVPGPEGWEVERQLLAASPRVEEIDPLLVSFLGGCDGSVAMRTQVRILAQAHEADEALLAASLSTVVRRLIRDGFLRIAD
ncbi:methyltransferase [Stackebrandtia nassauensis]|uniref:Methyltransferase small n=1 Tax=Stackebrandtia nassauensis (strain DSM 44728 / CIP 108903 / NRRL B-16338 / NBRC 102104 / LLR-40K-21) TaxID=446470 RepID=D3QAR9_STANL|nr:methyltransferase [Stackebrandtia nassauensis]ADD44715.1 methyltransferase small [Stackebrandtia nassauensis DSM 44728]